MLRKEYEFLFHRLGFILVLLPIINFWLDVFSNFKFHNGLMFFCILPVIRLIKTFNFNESENDSPDISQTIQLFLSLIPILFALCWSLSLLSVPFVIRFDYAKWENLFFIFFSCWICNSIGLTVMHELIHKRDLLHKFTGELLSCVSGIFYLSDEHQTHHRLITKCDDEEIPVQDENIYMYCLRMERVYLRKICEQLRSPILKSKEVKKIKFFLLKAFLTLGILGTFFIMGGSVGAIFYMGLMALTLFSYRVITYIQHWGLADCANSKLYKDVTWDSNCLFQSWITLNIAFHTNHHNEPYQPYYYLKLNASGPILATSYPLMFIATLFPPLFKRVMTRSLNKWLAENKNLSLTAPFGYKCFNG